MRVQTLRQRAYLLLKNKLANGELVSGTQLTETTLAKEFSMSRTPIREAIRQMEMEGFVEYAPRFGAIVRVLDRDELSEMYTVREALESYAAAEAARSITAEDLTKLEQLLQQMEEIQQEMETSGVASLEEQSLLRFLDIDLQFHQTIVRVSGNCYMAKILDGTRLLTRVFRSTLWVYNRKAIVEANCFHRQLFDALRERNSEDARTCAIEAMQVARSNALERWDEQQ